MQNRTALVILLAVMTVMVLLYTFQAMTGDARDFVTVFVDNIREMKWNGQFSLDFACYLLLSGLWIMWRSHFTFVSVLLALTAMVLGIVVFAPYLIYIIIKAKGDMRKVLLGYAA